MSPKVANFTFWATEFLALGNSHLRTLVYQLNFRILTTDSSSLVLRDSKKTIAWSPCACEIIGSQAGPT